MSKLTRREKNLLTFAIVFMTTVSIFYWGIIPIWQDYGRIKGELVEAKQAYQQAETIVSKEKTYIERHKAYQESYDNLKSRYYVNLDEEIGKIQFLSLVENLISESQITIISKGTLGVSEENGYKTLQVNLTLKGTSTQLTEVLLGFRNSPIAINVDRLRVDLDQRNRLLQLKLIVSTLILEEEGEEDVQNI